MIKQADELFWQDAKLREDAKGYRDLADKAHDASAKANDMRGSEASAADDHKKAFMAHKAAAKSGSRGDAAMHNRMATEHRYQASGRGEDTSSWDKECDGDCD